MSALAEMLPGVPAALATQGINRTLYRFPILTEAVFSNQKFPVALVGENGEGIYLGHFTTIKKDDEGYLPGYAAPNARVLVVRLEDPSVRRGDNHIVKVIQDQAGYSSSPIAITPAHVDKLFLVNDAVIQGEIRVGSVPGREGDVRLLYVPTRHANNQEGIHVLAINVTQERNDTVVKIGDLVQVNQHDHAPAYHGLVAGFRVNMPEGYRPEVLVDVMKSDERPLHRFSDYHLVSPTDAIL